jgi:hypothetical protein
MIRKLTILSIVAVLALGSSLPSFAAEKEKAAGATATAETGSKPIPYVGKVSAVDATAKTLTLKGKDKDRVLNITDSTKITKDGAPADLSAVTAGEEVRGQATKNGDKWDATSVMIGPKAASEKPAAEKKTKKAENKSKEKTS